LDEVGSWKQMDEVIPKRFKSDRSTATMTTIQSEQSEYRYSQDSNQGEEDEEMEEEKEEGVKELGRYAVIEDDCLKRLLKRCEECGTVLDQSLIDMRKEGSAWAVAYHCINHECNAVVTIETQKKVGKGRGQVYSFNHSLPIAAFITGTPTPRLCDLGFLLKLDLPSDRTMRKTVREIGSVSIERVSDDWQEMAREIAVDASEGNGLEVSIDGQFDAPGHTATNNKNTVIDCHTKLAIASAVLHKGLAGIDGVSCRMESVGTHQALVELIDNGVEIRRRVGDQNLMVNKILREDPKTANIEMTLDWWHVQKSMRKEWWKMVKANPGLAPFYRMFFNHLFHVHKKYPKKEDRPRALEVVQSFVMHIQGKHKWAKSEEFKLVTKCEHGKLKRMKKGEKRPTWKASSKELEAVREMLFAPKFVKAFLSAASLIDTAINESFHSLSLIAPHYYTLKTKVSILHYNSLVLDDLLGTRGEIGNTIASRKGRLVAAIKRKRGKG
ncbi:hypothetical protein PMAYCL1PPCAC_17410, partial [Pristionchus mayeri]